MNNLKNEENSNENLLHKLVTHGQDFLKDDQQINSMLPSNLFDELNDYRNSSHISENDLSYDEVTGDGNLYSLQKNLLEERSKSRDMLKQPFSEPIYNFNKKVDYMDEYQDLVDVNGRFNKIQISGGKLISNIKLGGGKDDLNSGSFTGTTSSNRRGSSSISRHKGSFQANEFVTKNTMFNTEENQIKYINGTNFLVLTN